MSLDVTMSVCTYERATSRGEHTHGVLASDSPAPPEWSNGVMRTPRSPLIAHSSFFIVHFLLCKRSKEVLLLNREDFIRFWFMEVVVAANDSSYAALFPPVLPGGAQMPGECRYEFVHASKLFALASVLTV